MQEIYEVPGSIKEMFEEDAGEYRIINYSKDMEMDNVEAMRHFIETVDIPSDYILLDVGTQVHFCHPDFSFHLAIDSYGGGDFFSHRYEVSKITAKEYLDELKSAEFPQEKTTKIKEIEKKEEESLTFEDLKEIFKFLNNL